MVTGSVAVIRRINLLNDGLWIDNFLALEITWWEKGNGVMLEAGICACRCRNIDAMVSRIASVPSEIAPSC